MVQLINILLHFVILCMCCLCVMSAMHLFCVQIKYCVVNINVFELKSQTLNVYYHVIYHV